MISPTNRRRTPFEFFACDEHGLYYRKRGSTSCIVREERSVRERERERERDTETDGSDVTIFALKLAMSLHLPLPKIRTWR